MAAVDFFHSFNASLSENATKALQSLRQEHGDELFAARSEEARLRIVHNYVKEAHELLKKSSRRS